MSHIAPQSTSYDLVVVGAGIVGLACAWRAAQTGLSVVVLERDEPGAGASGVAAGMLAPVTEADFGEEELLALNLESRALWPGFAAELEEVTGMSTGYSDCGALVVAADRDDAEELRRLQAYQERIGLGSEWLGPRAARALEPRLSPRVAGAIFAPQDSRADPGGTVAALVEALRSSGGELVRGAEVVSVLREGGRTSGVRTATAEVRAEQVLIAAGAWSASLSEDPPPVRPLKGQLLELRVRPGCEPLLARTIRTPRCYLVSRGDGRVILGATMEEQGFDTSVTADGVLRLLEAAYEVLPGVAELELVRARAGLRPATPANRPVVGGHDLLWATGHGRNGVLLAPLAARTIAARLDRQVAGSA